MNIIKQSTADFQVASLIVKNFSTSNDAVFVFNQRERMKGYIREKYATYTRTQLKKLPPISIYCDYYKRFGYSYPVLAQLESVLKEDLRLENENALHEILYLTELESMLLMACHDLDALSPPIHFESAHSEVDKHFIGIRQRECKIIPGDQYAYDHGGIITSVLKGPDYRTRVTEKTTNALFYLYYPKEQLDHTDIRLIKAALDRLEELLKAYSPKCSIELKGLL